MGFIDVSALVFEVYDLMKILIVSHNDKHGAGNAALKILNCLKNEKSFVKLLVLKKYSHSNDVIEYSLNPVQHIKNIINIFFNKIYNTFFSNFLFYSSLDLLSLNIHKYINESDYDLIQIIWPHRFLNIEDILSIKKKIIWRMSDYWLLFGSIHYPRDLNTINKLQQYKNKNFIYMLEYYIFLKKVRLIKKLVGIITPSKMLEGHVIQNNHFKNLFITQINTPINQKFYYPKDSYLSKKKIKIDPDKNYVLFISTSVKKNDRKGSEYFKKLIEYSNINDLLFLKVGSDLEFTNPQSQNKVINMGNVNNSDILNNIYNSSVITFIPSIIDNSPQVAIESLCAGTPVIASANSGLNDIYDHVYVKIYDKFIEKDIFANIEEIINLFTSKKLDRNKISKATIDQHSNEFVGKKLLNFYNTQN